MNIHVASVFEAIEIVQNNRNVYRVVSIMSPSSALTKNLFFYSARETLYLRFDDIVEKPRVFTPRPQRLASKKDCRKALHFITQQQDPCLIHCHAGISRSAAIALGALLSEYSIEEAITRLYKIRPQARPNVYIVKLMCQLLKMEHKYLDVLCCLQAARSFIDHDII